MKNNDTSELKKISVNTKRGFKLTLFDGDGITGAIKNGGEYDANTLKSIEEVLTLIQPDLSLDVGANIGNHAVVIAQYTQHLLAFEPVRFVYELLDENLKTNTQNTQAFNLGLSDIETTKDIYIQHLNFGCSSMSEQPGATSTIAIKTTVGDAFLAQHFAASKVDFIKIDVEGHEAAVLMGLEKTIKRDQPLILIEWKSLQVLDTFQEKNLFNQLFADYTFFALTNSDSKKLYPKTLFGYIHRLYCRFFHKKWCLTSFNHKQRYSNVYFVPKKHLTVFNQFDFKQSFNENRVLEHN